MRPFRIQSKRVERPPNGMLFWVEVRTGLLVVQFHERFFPEDLLHDFDEMNRHVTRSQLYMQEDDGTPVYTRGTHLYPNAVLAEEGTYSAHMENVSDKVLPLCPMGIHVENPHGILYLVRDDTVSPEMVRDYNEVVGKLTTKYKIWKPI